MTPTRITATGFLGFLETIDIDLTTIQAAMVSAPNGIGKSAAFTDTIRWALFNTCRNRGEDVIHNQAESAMVDIHFAHRGQAYSVVRKITRGRGQTLSLFSGAADISERLKGATQEHLQQILGFSDRLLLSTCLSIQDQANFFAVLPPAERGRVLMEMLDLALWDAKRQVVQTWVTAHKDVPLQKAIMAEEHEKLAGRLAILNDELPILKNRIEMLRPQLKSLGGSIQELHTTTALQSQRYMEAEERLVETTKRIEFIAHTLEDLPFLLNLENEIADILTQREGFSKDLEEWRIHNNSMRDNLGLARQLEQLGRGLATINTTILAEVPCRENAALFTNCLLLQAAHKNIRQQRTLIEQTFTTATEQHTFEEALQILRANIKQLEKQAQAQEEQIRILELRVQALSRTLIERQHLLPLAAQREALGEESIKLQADILEINQTLHESHTLQLQLEELQAQTAERLRLAQHLQLTESRLATVSAEQSQLIEKVGGSMAALATQEELELQLSQHQILLQAYQDVPALLFHESLPWIEGKANDILHEVAPGRMIEFQPFRDTKKGTQERSFELLVHTPEGSLVFDNLSGSQKFIVSLSLRLSLAKVLAETYNTPLDFFIVDEGFGSIHQGEYDIIKQCLRRMAQYFKLFLVISHVGELQDTFPSEMQLHQAPPYIHYLTHGG